jgi:hypothetical protein
LAPHRLFYDFLHLFLFLSLFPWLDHLSFSTLLLPRERW